MVTHKIAGKGGDKAKKGIRNTLKKDVTFVWKETAMLNLRL